MFQGMRQPAYILLVLFLLIKESAISHPDDGVILLSQGDIRITLEEAFQYSLRHTNAGAYSESLSKPQAVTRVLENLYILKRADQVAEEMMLFSELEKDYLLKDVSRRAALEKYLLSSLDERMAKVDWDGLAKAKYAANKADFLSDEEVRAEHILVAFEGRSFELFVARVGELRTALEDERDFKELIMLYSDDPSVGRNGGDLGFFSRKRMQPSFSEAAFSMTTPGEITGPVMTRFGAHFIRYLGRKDKERIPFNKVKKKLIESIKESTENKMRQELLDKFRTEIEHTVNEIDEPEVRAKLLKAYDAREKTANIPFSGQ